MAPWKGNQPTEALVSCRHTPRPRQLQQVPGGVNMQVSLSSFLFISRLLAIDQSHWKTEDKGVWVMWSTEPSSRAEKSSRVGDTQHPCTCFPFSLHHRRLPFPPLPSPSLLVLAFTCQVDWSTSLGEKCCLDGGNESHRTSIHHME